MSERKIYTGKQGKIYTIAESSTASNGGAKDTREKDKVLKSIEC